MRNLVKFFILSGFISLSGCDNTITNFVQSAKPPPPSPTNGTNPSQPSPPSNSASGPTHMKVSPGQMKATSANASMVGNITITNSFTSSANVSARVSISRGASSTQ